MPAARLPVPGYPSALRRVAAARRGLPWPVLLLPVLALVWAATTAGAAPVPDGRDAGTLPAVTAATVTLSSRIAGPAIVATPQAVSTPRAVATVCPTGTGGTTGGQHGGSSQAGGKGSGHGSLAFTGTAHLAALIVVGVLLLLIGVVLAGVGRRRRPQLVAILLVLCCAGVLLAAGSPRAWAADCPPAAGGGAGAAPTTGSTVDPQWVQVTVPSGTLTLSTRFADGNPFTLADAGHQAWLAGDLGDPQHPEDGVTITDTRTGAQPWTASATTVAGTALPQLRQVATAPGRAGTVYVYGSIDLPASAGGDTVVTFTVA